MPRTDQVQTESLKTWKKRGLTICTVQALGESEKCKSLYPDVDHWLETEETGKPRISEIVKRAATIFEGKNLMLINGDIGIDESHPFPSIGDELIAYPRYDYQNHGGKTKMNRWGLDVFMFTPKTIELLIDSPFQIGEPCWDYWVPFHYLHIGVPVSIATDKLFFHQKHPKRWSRDDSKMREEQLKSLYGLDKFYGSGFRRMLRKFETTRA